MILVDIYVPAVDKSYDFNLEESVPVRVIIEEIIEMISQKERTSFSGDAAALALCDRQRQKLLSKGSSLRQNGVHNGSSLILV